MDDKNPSSPEPPMMLAVDDLAHHLRCSTDTVYRLLSTGELPQPDFVRNRLKLWARSTFVEWIESHRQDSSPAHRRD